MSLLSAIAPAFSMIAALLTANATFRVFRSNETLPEPPDRGEIRARFSLKPRVGLDPCLPTLKAAKSVPNEGRLHPEGLFSRNAKDSHQRMRNQGCRRRVCGRQMPVRGSFAVNGMAFLGHMQLRIRKTAGIPSDKISHCSIRDSVPDRRRSFIVQIISQLASRGSKNYSV